MAVSPAPMSSNAPPRRIAACSATGALQVRISLSGFNVIRTSERLPPGSIVAELKIQ